MRGKLLRAVAGEGVGKRKILVAAAILVLAGATAGGVGAAVRAQNEPANAPYGVGRALTEEEAAAGATVEAQYFDTFEEALESIGADPEDFDASAADPGADANPIADPPSDPEPTKHCIAQIEPLKTGGKASEMSEATCFDSFQEALQSIGADPEDFDVNPADEGEVNQE